MSATSAKVSNIVNKVVNEVIETPIAVLKEKVKDTTKEDILERIHAVTSELIRLQYSLREFSIVEWYDNELDDRRKHLHDVFEQKREFFKAGANGDNWLAITNADKAPANINGFEKLEKQDDQGPYYFAYFKDTDALNVALTKMRTRDKNKLLCVPLFKAS